MSVVAQAFEVFWNKYSPRAVSVKAGEPRTTGVFIEKTAHNSQKLIIRSSTSWVEVVRSSDRTFVYPWQIEYVLHGKDGRVSGCRFILQRDGEIRKIVSSSPVSQGVTPEDLIGLHDALTVSV